MTSRATQYRREHPEYYAQERQKDKERVKTLYQNDPEYREKRKKQVLERYHRLKAEKKSLAHSSEEEHEYY
jgi:hypothetical protein